MGLTNLETVKSFAEYGFAIKGSYEHIDALAGSDSLGDTILAASGIAADVTGAAQMGGEKLIDKFGDKIGPKLVDKFGDKFGAFGESTPSKFKEAYNPSNKQMKGLGTPIIGAALLTLNGMQLMCGMGEPDTGDRFAKGADNFTAISDVLKRATPTELWHGSGSDAYTAQNERQQDRASTMGQIDTDVKGIIADEAQQIKATRNVLDVSATLLTFMIPIAIVIGKIPPTGPANQMVFELSAVAATMPGALAAFGTMEALTLANAQKFRRAASAYREVAAGAKPTGAAPAVGSPPGGNTTSRPWSPSAGSSTGTGEGSINV